MELEKIQALVGNITQDQMKDVRGWITDELGIFIPSTGFCKYAVTPEHTHPVYSFYYALSDNTHIHCRGQEYRSETGKITVLAPGVPHHEVVKKGFSRYVALFVSEDFFTEQHALYSFPHIEEFMVIDSPGRFLQDVKEFLAEKERGLPGCDKVLKARAEVIVHSLLRSLLGIHRETTGTDTRLEIDRVIEYLHSSYEEKITVKEMALRAGMSESHFARTFKEETGVPPLEFLTRLRINKAREFLRDKTLNITEVAFRCGFNSLSHFSHTFNHIEKVTPSVYRKAI